MLGNTAARREVAVMHVPKTAGHSITGGLTTALKPMSAVGGYDRSLFGDFHDFDSFDAPLRRTVYLNSMDFPPNADLVIGHISRSTLHDAYPSHRKITVVREPRCRLISNWLFWRANSDEQLTPWGGWAERVKISRRPFLQFLTEPKIASHTDNLLLRMLLWPHAKIPDAEFISAESDRELLDAGRDALNSFNFVGAIEEPSLERRLGEFLGAELSMPRLNETSALPPALRPVLLDEIDAPTLTVLLDRCRLDAVLWSEVVAPLCAPYAPAIVGERAVLRALFRYADLGIARLTGSVSESAREQALTRVAAIERSASWRLTAPLRVFAHAARGGSA